MSPGSDSRWWRECARRGGEGLGVDKVGFMAHSSFDVSVLSFASLRRALRSRRLPGGGHAALRHARARAARGRPRRAASSAGAVVRSDLTPIPEFKPKPTDASLWEEVTVPGVGHADVLDDVWADMGPRFIPWMNGPEPPSKPFREWSSEHSKVSTTRAIRRAYRQRVADLDLAHLLTDVDVLHAAPEPP